MYGVTLLIVLPYIYISLNQALSLPVYSSPLLTFSGIACILIGLSYWAHSIKLFLIIGKGTPVPIDPPQKLVTQGLYRYTRNPMYCSVLLILVGYFGVFGHLLLIVHPVLMFIVFHIMITRYEEPTLINMFGKDYVEYCSKVRRWI